MAGNSGGPWGGGSGGSNGSGGNGRGDDRNSGGGRRPGGDGPQIPEIDEIMKKGQEQLRVLMGGRGGGSRNGGGGGPTGPWLTRGTALIGVGVAAVLWALSSFYTVKPEEQSVELFLGRYSATGGPGLNFAPWPVVTAEVVPVTRENIVDIGNNRGSEQGLMLTTDENIVDIEFQVVWNINDLQKYLFNLAEPEQTIEAVSEAAMREIVARSELAPILNRDRGVIAADAQQRIQETLDEYDAGINIIRVNLDKADPPLDVIDSYKAVQAAEQKRDELERNADRDANTVLGKARGEAAELLERAEGYRAEVVNGAEGEASRFTAVLGEYEKAPEVTRKRLYLETMEKVLGSVNKVILDEGNSEGGGQGVVPYLPLDQLRRTPNTGGN